MPVRWKALIFLSAAAACSISWAADIIRLQRDDGKSLSARVYFPANECKGIAIISHGAGGSEQGYGYLARFMASQDYLTVVPGHQESGMKVLLKFMQGKDLPSGLSQLVTDKAAYAGRLMDISAARQWSAPRCSAKTSILLGHSMGAATTMIVAGAENKMGIDDTVRKSLLTNPGFDRYVALSPQGVGSIFPGHAWVNIHQPVLLMTGTKDEALGGGSWNKRTEAFADMPAGCKWLGVINGATHMNFAGRDLTPQMTTLITKTIGDFLQAAPDRGCTVASVAVGLTLSTK
ncbi:alpha/beta hydrolase family protein [Undibacterium sp. SXout11W]|uniref:alpha/beta hydrolase family protein n=1 Tax=Undibacterium sp. SXout11W TaxID=3413050 RepID=UPI003BF25E7F